jgi:hypothetical protein
MAKTKKIIIFLLITLIFPFYANAASLYFSPSSGSYDTGSILSLNVYVSSSDQAMNAASGVISFPVNKLEAVSIFRSESIFSLWVQDPSFSNSSGTIDFEGVIFNPGFTGTSGKIMTINFKVKEAGNTNISFSSGSVLANDGKATNILSKMDMASFILVAPVKEVKDVEKETNSFVSESLLVAPNVYSSTHPDSNKWYNLSNINLYWDVPSEAIGTRTLLGKNQESIPTTIYEPPISRREIKGVSDGIWYFHSQFKNTAGWGEVDHFKIQIDTQSPEIFSINFIGGKIIKSPQPKISFKTEDSLSGIDYYEIIIEKDDPIRVFKEEAEAGDYILPIQSPGKKNITINAFDKAGNVTSVSDEFTVSPLDAPIITDYTNELQDEEILAIKGKTNYPNGKVVIYFEKNNEIVNFKEIKTNSLGEFSFASDSQMEAGIYTVWAEVIDKNSSKSLPSEPVDILVVKHNFLKGSIRWFGTMLTSIPSYYYGLLFLIILLVFYCRFFYMVKRLKKEIIESEEVLKEAFNFLREGLDDQIKLLIKTKAKRGLTEEEEMLIDKLKKSIGYIERLIGKEIRDIKNEIK